MPYRAVPPIESMCFNTSVDSKPTLERIVSGLLTHTPSVLEWMTSVQSSLLGVFRSPTHRAGELTRELVSYTTVMLLVLVRSKHIEGPLVEMTRCPFKPLMERIWNPAIWQPSNLWMFFTT